MEEFKPSARQRRIIEDPRVTFLGIDERNRPVVQMMSGIPQRMMRWALTRDGNAADISGRVTKIHLCKKVYHFVRWLWCEKCQSRSIETVKVDERYL